MSSAQGGEAIRTSTFHPAATIRGPSVGLTVNAGGHADRVIFRRRRPQGVGKREHFQFQRRYRTRFHHPIHRIAGKGGETAVPTYPRSRTAAAAIPDHLRNQHLYPPGANRCAKWPQHNCPGRPAAAASTCASATNPKDRGAPERKRYLVTNVAALR
jgi:hypothetical protein